MSKNETRTPMEMASYVINSTKPGTLELRAAAGLYDDDGEMGALLQAMYEQSSEQADLSHYRRVSLSKEGVQE